MTQVILQPVSHRSSSDSGHRIVRNNLKKTIWNSFPVASFPSSFRREFKSELDAIAENGKIKCWGVASGRAIAQWKKIRSGDIALLASEVGVEFIGCVAFKAVSEELGRNAWLNDPDVGFFDHQYFFSSYFIPDKPIPKRELNALLGYDAGYNWMGMTVKAGRVAERTLEHPVINAWLSSMRRQAIEKDLKELAKLEFPENEEETDGESTTRRRKEQRRLRDFLLDGRISAPCAVCGEQFPSPMLVAAHLKKRARCTNVERLQFDRVAALMCKFGCDELFERGYVYAQSGTWKVRNDLPQYPRVSSLLKTLSGSKCEIWQQSQAFLEWHAKYTVASRSIT